MHGRGEIEYIPFPADLTRAYQPVTEADIGRLRRDGYTEDFVPIEQGVPETLGSNAQTPV